MDTKVGPMGYGPYLWQVCKYCNADRHRCGCGEPLRHAQNMCEECEQRFAADPSEW